MFRWVRALFLLFLPTGPLAAQIVAGSYAGRYTGVAADGSRIVLDLKVGTQGKVVGTLERADARYQLEADPGLDEIIGVGSSPRGSLYLEGHREGGSLRLLMAGMNATGQPDYQHASEATLSRAEASEAPPGGGPVADTAAHGLRPGGQREHSQ